MTQPILRHTLAALPLVVLLATPLAHADLAPPPPPPECNGTPPGTPCQLFDHTAGVCAHHQDTRRPGREWVVCERDEHECDRLAVGAACHGYLGRPAHCREFADDATHRRWRTCQVDESAYAPGAPANGSDASAPSADATSGASTVHVNANANTNANASANTNAPAPTRAAHAGCASGPQADRGSAAGLLFGLAMGLVLFRGLRQR